MEKAINRQRVLLGHLQPSSSDDHQNYISNVSPSICLAEGGKLKAPSGDDVVIVAAYRTPLCKAKRGGFKDTHPDDLLAAVLKALIDKTHVKPTEVGDVIVGTVLAPGSLRAIEFRMGQFYAGFPATVPIRTVNRQCSSGLQAVADVAAYIKAGYYDIGIGAGVECMSIDTISNISNPNPKVRQFSVSFPSN
ncbi:hypothetical protein Leryth_003297 [Lithospermum erythrorhizon]|nr:hypothetical protein Leryth_003297 [Lithospermum erythrorhizon]